jgi:hypothetical protein
VPLVVAKPAREPEPSGPDPAQQAELLPDAGLKVLAADSDVGRGSALDLFDPRDPFRPPQNVIDEGEPKNQNANAKPAGAGSSGGGGGDATLDLGLGELLGGGSPTAPVGGGPPRTPPIKTEQFTYVVDVTFQNDGDTRRIRSLRRLSFLPGERNPLLLFLGVSSDLNNAVFMVDSTLEPNGEGTCKPNPDNCSLLYLGAGELHYFTEEDGTTYALQLDQIRRVKVSGRASSSKGAARHRSEGSTRSKRPQARRSFVPPIFSDLVRVAKPRKAR